MRRLGSVVLLFWVAACEDDSGSGGANNTVSTATSSSTTQATTGAAMEGGSGGGGGDHAGGGGSGPGETRLLLAPRFYGVVGADFDLIYRNLILTEDPSEYTVEVTSDLDGVSSSEAWQAIPTSSGTYTLQVRVQNATTNALIEEATSSIIVSSDLGISRTSVIFVGDSLTDSQAYPGHVALDMPNVTTIGSKTFMGIEHEGWSGSHWTRFATHYEVPEGAVPNSPFLSAPATLDIPGYLGGLNTTPDVVCWFLGTNDVFTAQLSALETTIDAALTNADTLLNAWDAALPGVRHAILLMPAGNDRQSAFDANYQAPLNDRWAWRQKQHRWLERNIAHFAGRPNVHIVPLYHAVDGTLGYPEGNALHPDSIGQRSIADAVEAWLAAER